MKTSNYWDKRSLKRLTEAEKHSEAYINKVKAMYDQAFRDIERELASVYRNYSNETGVDTQKLKELLTRSETKKTWDQMKRQGLDKYVLNNYKSRISRLEQIQAQIYAKAKLIYPKEELANTMCYKGVINQSYYKTIYDTQMGTGYDFNFNTIDNNMVDALLNESWSGKNYSKRIWDNTDILADSVSKILGGAMLSGQGIERTTKQLRDRFGVSKYYAERLIRTETNHFNNEADAMAYEDLGLDKYVFVATLDSRTSEICQSMDNKVFKFSEREEGVNYPPLHPNCRSKTRAYLGKEEEKTLKRRARNPITGKTELIDNMNYQDWLKQYNIVNNKNGMFITNKNVIYNTNSLNKLNSNLVETNAKQLDNLLNKYPTIAKYIKERGLIYGGSNRTNAIAYTRYGANFKNMGIYLEKNYYQNSDKHIKVMKNAIDRGEFMPCSNKNIDKYAITHEYGHVVESYLLKKYSDSNVNEYKKALTSQYSWTKYKDKVYNNIRQEIVNIAIKKNANFDINTQLSIYGKSSPAEFFAEAFANSECGKPNELGKALQEYLKGVL